MAPTILLFLIEGFALIKPFLPFLGSKNNAILKSGSDELAEQVVEAFSLFLLQYTLGLGPLLAYWEDPGG